MKLKDLLENVPLLSVSGSRDAKVSFITSEYKKVKKNAVFVALERSQSDGHLFIESAVAKKASVIICNKLPETLENHVTYLQVADPALTLGKMAAHFYGNPSHQLKLVAVTGTNGKTTTATLLFRLFRTLGYQTALLSTVQNQINDQVFPAERTTPKATALNHFLAQAVEAGCTHAFMEASSHGIALERIAGLHFAGAIFTNLTRDHLDFHLTLEKYRQAKKKLFDDLPATAFALTNRDDPQGLGMLADTKATRHTFSLQSQADFTGKILSDTWQGLEMQINEHSGRFKLSGNFNAYNLLGIYGAAVLLGENPETVMAKLSEAEPVAGRFEKFTSPANITGFVDFAHNPDALENILKTITSLKGSYRLITVCGCGGNRDTGKRPLMAKIACEFSDVVILTADNPRYEDPQEILSQMYAGVDNAERHKTEIIPDRKAAILKAVSMAMPFDIILIAGKGHEAWQEINGIKYPFDDREILKNALLKANVPHIL